VKQNVKYNKKYNQSLTLYQWFQWIQGQIREIRAYYNRYEARTTYEWNKIPRIGTRSL